MEFINSTAADLEAIFELYDAAIVHQKAVSNMHWLPFDRQLVAAEIAEGREQIDQTVERFVRERHVARVGAHESSLEPPRVVRQLARGQKEFRGQVETHHAQAVFGEQKRVAPETAAQIEHTASKTVFDQPPHLGLGRREIPMWIHTPIIGAKSLLEPAQVLLLTSAESKRRASPFERRAS